MSDISQIDGQSVRLKREALGMAVTDLATLACLSTKQIKQIEEGGISAFYSENVKLTAARKIAALLQMSEAQLFGQVQPEVVENPPESDVLIDALQQTHATFQAEPANLPPVHAHHAALLRSEALHVLAQPPEDVELVEEKETGSQPLAAEQTAALDMTPSHPVLEPQSETNQAAGGSSYVFKILALFLVALAIAAVMRPKPADEKVELNSPDTAAPAPPPLQAPVGSETPAAASDNQPAAIANPGNISSPAEKPASAITSSPAQPASDSAGTAAK